MAARLEEHSTAHALNTIAKVFHPLSKMLCLTCDSIFSSIPKSGKHHPSLQTLKSAAFTKCPICLSLLHYFLQRDEKDTCLYYSISDCSCETGTKTFELYFFTDDILLIPRKFLAMLTSILKPNLNIGNRHGSPSPAEAVSMVKTWLAGCDESHTHCAKFLPPDMYPTRLLYLDGGKIRLVNTLDEKPRGPYTALSYAWGPSPNFLRLTDSNLFDLASDIPISSLPRVFIEIIQFVRGLSISYIWIDSLCIIQEGPSSAEDWRRESARMGEIYSNSYLTIAASRAFSPVESCYGKRETSMMPQIRLDCEDFKFSKFGQDFTIFDKDHFGIELNLQPLTKRAWALQERFLSPRLISFGQFELFWDCRGLPNACESFPLGFNKTTTESRKFLGIAEKQVAIYSQPNELYSQWARIVDDYTHRTLTYPEKDKLVALSAVARQMSNALGDIYLAGHFRKTLPRSLNWRSKGFNGRRIVPEKGYRYPSWSWASMDGPLQFRCGSMWTILVSVDAYKLKLVSEDDPTGQIVFASLQLTGYVIPAGSKDEFDGLADLDDPDLTPEECEMSEIYILPLFRDGDFMVWEGLVIRATSVYGSDADYFERIGHISGPRPSEVILNSTQRTIILV